jgi:hypothetical protein
VDGTGSGSCRVAGSGVSGVETSGSASRDDNLLLHAHYLFKNY